MTYNEIVARLTRSSLTAHQQDLLLEIFAKFVAPFAVEQLLIELLKLMQASQPVL